MLSRDQWLKARQQGIGSSDAPCLVGVGYRTARDIYRDKTEPIEDRPPTGVMRRGIALERTVADMYTEATGVKLRHGALMTSNNHPWQLANPDCITHDFGRLVELKTTAGFRYPWGEPGTDQIPDGYRIQCQHQLGVTGHAVCDVAALDVIHWELRIYHVVFDPDLFAAMSAVQLNFWGHVLNRTPITAEWEQLAAGEVVRRIEPGKRVELGDDVAALCQRRRELRAISDEADDEADRLTREIERRMGDAQHGTAPGFKLKWVTRKGYTRKACDVDPCTYLDIRAAKPGKGDDGE